MKLISILLSLSLCAVVTLPAKEPVKALHPYTGPSLQGVDATTLTGKVMTGYQGWFNCEGDGADLGWKHWAANRKEALRPGNITVDLWPDVNELGPAERFKTEFKLVDGTTAEVFSSFNKDTVLRHFEWMRDYGIDGVFVQRFANGLRRDDKEFHHKNAVLANCREGADRNGRAYAVMYDLSGLPAGGVATVWQDWRMLRDAMKITDDAAYLHHKGKPVVAVWGVGFNDDRKYTLAECREFVTQLKADGCTVMLGVPTGWRELNRDAMPDPALHDVLKLADVISPWTIGRYRNPNEVARHKTKVTQPDLAWCQAQSLDYLPVVFPGFSWHNMNPEAPLDAIPRLKGEFLWSQLAAAKSAGASMIYVAMFDEVDEATAIFKCTNTPPVGSSPFLNFEGLPSDHYLWLTGQGGRLLRGELPIQESMPTRNR